MSKPAQKRRDMSFYWKTNPAEPSTHNGNLEVVYSAIVRGNAELPGIMRVTGLDENAVRNAVRRLADKKRIRRLTAGGYSAVTKECRLAEVWR